MTCDFIRGFNVSFAYTKMIQKKTAFVKPSFLNYKNFVLVCQENRGLKNN